MTTTRAAKTDLPIATPIMIARRIYAATIATDQRGQRSVCESTGTPWRIARMPIDVAAGLLAVPGQWLLARR
jgi:hypothetical protein